MSRTEALLTAEALSFQRNMKLSLKKREAVRGRLEGAMLECAGLVPPRRWQQDATAYQRGKMRAWGSDGFCNRGARRAAHRKMHGSGWCPCGKG